MNVQQNQPNAIDLHHWFHVGMNADGSPSDISKNCNDFYPDNTIAEPSDRSMWWSRYLQYTVKNIEA